MSPSCTLRQYKLKWTIRRVRAIWVHFYSVYSMAWPVSSKQTSAWYNDQHCQDTFAGKQLAIFTD